MTAIRTQIERSKHLLQILERKHRTPSARPKRTASTPITSYKDAHNGTTRLIVAYEGRPLVFLPFLPDHYRQMFCPDAACQRSDFVNMQGFVNHCRIVHSIEAKSHSHAIRDWGKAVQVSVIVSCKQK